MKRIFRGIVGIAAGIIIGSSFLVITSFKQNQFEISTNYVTPDASQTTLVATEGHSVAVQNEGTTTHKVTTKVRVQKINQPKHHIPFSRQ